MDAAKIHGFVGPLLTDTAQALKDKRTGDFIHTGYTTIDPIDYILMKSQAVLADDITINVGTNINPTKFKILTSNTFNTNGNVYIDVTNAYYSVDEYLTITASADIETLIDITIRIITDVDF